MGKENEHTQKPVDPATGIRPISEWGSACARGFVSDSRFGSGQVITAQRQRRPVSKEARS